MSRSGMTIRTATPADLDTMIEWAAAEGWNPGLADRDAFLAADAAGFLIGALGEEAIASISVVKYGSDFGFLGFYIVRPEFRGQGHGMTIWQAGMARLQGRTIGLDGVVEQQANYAKSGFVLAYGHYRYEGRGRGEDCVDAQIVPLADVEIDALLAYDRAMFAQSREAFLRAWITRPGSVGRALKDAGALRGYGVIRPSRTGYRIGPLFADTPDGAARLLSALLASAPRDAPVFIDVPVANTAATALVESLQMQPAFATARMYAGPAPQLPVSCIYGVTSLELG
jgi:hypothetical protein